LSLGTLSGHILTPDGFVRGELTHEDGRVLRVQGDPVAEAVVLADRRPVVLPGFVDLHVHGGGGHDTMAGGAAVAEVARVHARHGTTALLATTMTAPRGEIESALRAPFVQRRIEGGARVLGVHLEGPYINPARLGAQPDFAAVAMLPDILALHALAPIRLITIAPEADHDRPGATGAPGADRRPARAGLPGADRALGWPL